MVPVDDIPSWGIINWNRILASNKQVYRRRYESRHSPKTKTALRKKIKYCEKRFSVWRMKFFHHAMWHVARGSWHWIHQVAGPCNVIRGSGMTGHWIRPNVRHIGILLLVSISTISPQSTRHSARVCEILLKSDRPRSAGKNDFMSIFKMADLRRLGFYGFNNGFIENPCTTSVGRQ